MTSYRAAEGTNVALLSLTTLSPQPDERHPGGIQYTSVERVGNGGLSKQGPYFRFVWEQLSAAQYATILAVFGVNDQDTASVTIYVRDVDMATWVRMNGIAQRPFPGDGAQWDIRPVDLSILVTDLTAAS